MTTLEYTELQNLDDRYLLCKGMRLHKLDLNPSPQVIYGTRASMATYVIALRCERCGRERYEFLDSAGNRLGTPYYKDPIDYPRTTRLLGNDVRAELVRRSLLVQRLVDGEIVPMKRTRRRRT